MGPDISGRKKASDFDPGLLSLLDEYVHGRIDRRGFLEGAQKYAVGGVTATALFEMLKPNYAWSQQVKKDDARIRVETVTVQSPQGTGSIKGQLARPAKEGKYPVVLVIHENRGLNPYVEDVGRRLATEGFITFAGDGLTSVGGYPGDDEKGGQLFGTVDRAKMLTDFIAAARYLKARPDSTGKFGAVGFCFGGLITNQLAVALGPDMAAGVPYYGGAPPLTDVPKIKAALLVQHGSLDTRLVEGWPAYDKALTDAKVVHEGQIYQNANHGFHNDTTPRYDEAAAKQSWTRTVAWFKKYLA